MKFYYALYSDEKSASDKEEIRKKLKKNKLQVGKFLIALTENENNHLEFFNTMLLLQKRLAKKNMFVVGVASGYDGAMEVVEKITQEVYDETGGADIRRYILQRQRDFEEGNV